MLPQILILALLSIFVKAQESCEPGSVGDGINCFRASTPSAYVRADIWSFFAKVFSMRQKSCFFSWYVILQTGYILLLF